MLSVTWATCSLDLLSVIWKSLPSCWVLEFAHRDHCLLEVSHQVSTPFKVDEDDLVQITMMNPAATQAHRS